MVRWMRRDGWTRELVAECIDGTIDHVIPFYAGECWLNRGVVERMVGDRLPTRSSYADCSYFYVVDEGRIVKTSLSIEIKACIPSS